MDSSLNSDMGSSMAEGGAHEICAPLEALQIDGQSPVEGDEVEVTVRGVVTRLEGDKAYLEPLTFNDVPAPISGEEAEPSEDDLRSALNQDQNIY